MPGMERRARQEAELIGLGDRLGMERDEGDRVKDNCNISGWITLSFTEMGNSGLGRKDNAVGSMLNFRYLYSLRWRSTEILVWDSDERFGMEGFDVSLVIAFLGNHSLISMMKLDPSVSYCTMLVRTDHFYHCTFTL